MAAVRYTVGIRAAATHEANNYAVATLDSRGNTVNENMRDATAAPRKYGIKRLPEVIDAPPAQVAKVFKVAPWEPARTPSAAAIHRKRERSANADLLERRVAVIGQSLCVSATSVTGVDRMRALRARVLGAEAAA